MGAGGRGAGKRGSEGTAGRESARQWHSERAEAAKAVMAARFRERLTVADVARAVHVSPYHLCRIFRRQTGATIHGYLIRLRVKAAVESLAGPEPAGDLSVLALELGFSSHSHFTSVFRRELGVPPSAVRRGGPGTAARFGAGGPPTA